MSEARQILVLTYAMAAIEALRLLAEPAVLLRGLATAVPLVIAALVLLRIRAKRRATRHKRRGG